MKKYLKNIEHEAVVKLTDLVDVQPGQVVSKTLAQNRAVSVTLFAFTVGGTPHIVHAGETLVMPAGVPHAVYAEEAFKWVLTVVFPDGYEE